jgi:hypothetical protein
MLANIGVNNQLAKSSPPTLATGQPIQEQVNSKKRDKKKVFYCEPTYVNSRKNYYVFFARNT